MFLGQEESPFRFVAIVPTTAIQLKSSVWPPCSDMGFAPDDNLLFLRYCSREYWDYLQVLCRKSDTVSETCAIVSSAAAPDADARRMPHRNGPSAGRSTAAGGVPSAFSSSSSCPGTIVFLKRLSSDSAINCYVSAVFSSACASSWRVCSVSIISSFCRKVCWLHNLDKSSVFARYCGVAARSRSSVAAQPHNQLVCGSM